MNCLGRGIHPPVDRICGIDVLNKLHCDFCLWPTFRKINIKAHTHLVSREYRRNVYGFVIDRDESIASVLAILHVSMSVDMMAHMVGLCIAQTLHRVVERCR